MPEFDRFDIAEAHWLFFCHWHDGGPMYARYSCQFSRLRFRPGVHLNDVHDLTENGQEIYHLLVEKLKKELTIERTKDSGAAGSRYGGRGPERRRAGR